jgi:hypothetical protein
VVRGIVFVGDKVEVPFNALARSRSMVVTGQPATIAIIVYQAASVVMAV